MSHLRVLFVLLAQAFSTYLDDEEGSRHQKGFPVDRVEEGKKKNVSIFAFSQPDISHS